MNSTDRRRLAGLKSFGNRPQELSFISSDRDPFDFVERDLIAGMVIEFCRTRAFMRGQIGLLAIDLPNDNVLNQAQQSC